VGLAVGGAPDPGASGSGALSSDEAPPLGIPLVGVGSVVAPGSVVSGPGCWIPVSDWPSGDEQANARTTSVV
jgi:hypothetical protein